MARIGDFIPTHKLSPIPQISSPVTNYCWRKFLIGWISKVYFCKTFYKDYALRWNRPWCGEGPYLAVRLGPVRQQGELVVATQLRLIIANRSLCLCQGPNSKWKNLDYSSLLVFNILFSFASLLSGRLILYIDIYHLFAEPCIIGLSLQLSAGWGFVSGSEIWYF